MYRSLFRCVTVILNQNNSVMQMNSQTKNILWCYRYNKFHRSQSTADPDDDNDAPLYHEAEHRRLSRVRFIDFLTKNLCCSPARADQICTNYPKFRERTLQEVSKNVNFLISKGVTQMLILENPWIFTINYVHLSSNICILEEMKPKNVNDFAPLAIVPSEKLIQIKEISKEEANVIPGNHRIYYFSELLQMSPCTVSKNVSNHPLVLEMPFNILDSRTKALLRYIDPDLLVNNMGLLKFCISKIENLLIEAKKSKLSTRVRNSSKSIVFVKISNKMKAILGSRYLVQYYSDRLNVDIERIEVMLQQHPALRGYRVKNIERKLDYLLYEAGVCSSDILLSAQVLTMSLVKIKERVEQLQLFDGHKRNYLKCVALSTKQYNKYIEKLKKLTGVNS